MPPTNDLVINREHGTNWDSPFPQPFLGFFDGGVQKTFHEIHGMCFVEDESHRLMISFIE